MTKVLKWFQVGEEVPANAKFIKMREESKTKPDFFLEYALYEIPITPPFSSNPPVDEL